MTPLDGFTRSRGHTPKAFAKQSPSPACSGESAAPPSATLSAICFFLKQ
jgi:hypothetical protein